jgi:hypothetical protein
VARTTAPLSLLTFALLTGLVGLAGAPREASAQFPFPFPEPEPPAKDISRPVDTSTVATNDKTYTPPEAAELPPGPAETLSGFVARVDFTGMVNRGWARM